MPTTDAKPDVSILIPVYNAVDRVGAALDSVADQTFDGRLQVIVVDDGSTDGSGERAAQHPVTDQVLRQSNKGVTATRSRAIDHAEGEWLAFLDADDRWHPSKLERQFDHIEAPCLCFTRYRRVREDGEAVDAPRHPAEDLHATPQKLITGNFIGNSTALIHRRCATHADGYPADRSLDSGGQDYAFWLRIASAFPLVYVPEVLVDYGVHADNRIGTDPVAHFRGGLNALEDFHGWNPSAFRRLAGMSLQTMIVRRTSQFVLDAAGRIGRWPADAVPRALAEVASRYGPDVVDRLSNPFS
jgi:glycosyltransferase involved in cell wall biosynthesis